MVDFKELLAKLVLSISYNEFIKACKENDVQPESILDLLESNGYTRL